mgnify:CR=1 FL=1
MKLKLFSFCFIYVSCSTGELPKSNPELIPSILSKKPGKPAVYFTDIAEEVGLFWSHNNGASTMKFFPETMSGGGAFFDADNDGDLDIYAVDGGNLSDLPESRPGNALFINEKGYFKRVIEAAGANDHNYGMGVSVGDIDGDGDDDLYITNFGLNTMYRNNDGEFLDISKASKTNDPLWGASAAFSDYDLDGDLDLYVTNYVKYELADANKDYKPYLNGYSDQASDSDLDAEKGYPHPANFQGVPDKLYMNNGSGFFDDVTEISGIYDTSGKGLGVVFADYDIDGWPDIYVANDAVRNFLYHNKGDGTFVERGSLSGIAYGQDGQMEAGMGVDWGDYDLDGDLDLTVTNFQSEPNSLYRYESNHFFSTATFNSGIGTISLPFLGFGTQFLDIENDGDLDIFVANGHVLDNISSLEQIGKHAQRNLLFTNKIIQEKVPQFEEIGEAIGFVSEKVSRGSAVADYDFDGDLDLLIFNNGDQVQLLRNDGGNLAGHWLSIRLIGENNNKSGIGSRITLFSNNKRFVREVRADKSYLSHSDSRLHFGLGKENQADSVCVRWPNKNIVQECFGPIKANKHIVIKKSAGYTLD